MKKTIRLFCICIMLIGCGRTPVVNKNGEAESIRKIEEQWTIAIKTKDIDKTLSFFAPGAVVMNANTPACAGIQAIRKSQESWFDDTTIIHNTFTSSIDTIEISASGDLAYVRGNSKLSIRRPEGIVEEPDKWITIYKKINRGWKVIVDIWNSDLPLI